MLNTEMVVADREKVLSFFCRVGLPVEWEEKR